MQPSMIVKPKRNNTDDPVTAPVAIFLLMVHHPELAAPNFGTGEKSDYSTRVLWHLAHSHMENATDV
jgi:hypothetical protein